MNEGVLFPGDSLEAVKDLLRDTFVSLVERLME